tara:strand:- start:540 stop:1100 length:561 start_codon:yes stop_codon:yes gene_type:complete
MGYTHYWTQARDFTDVEWLELTRLTKLITADGVDVLAYHPNRKDYTEEVLLNGDPDTFTINNEEIRFNGIGEDGHETFLITKKKPAKPDYEEQEVYDKRGAFDFCKTARKPYDKYVVAVLCAIYNMFGHYNMTPMSSIMSDGKSDDWKEGMFHAVRSTREEEMSIPFQETLTLSYVDYIDREKKTG